MARESSGMTDATQLTPVRGKYHLLMELGRGGMGVVHLAMARGPQGFIKLVVLKMLHPELVASDAARRMFLEEARISARLAHPNVVQVYEVIEVDGAPTMVMEYLEGRPLSTVIGDDPARLPVAMHAHVYRDVLAGLHAAHELRDYDGTPLGLIHRDVSPHNVILLFDGRVKVLDFGIAKAAGSAIETQTGELKGKLRYMAPEQLRGDRSIDRRADVFSVGVMLWEGLAGRRIWADLSDADVMLRLLNHQIPSLPADPRIPAGLARVCAKALSPSCGDRYVTAAAFQRELEQHLVELPEIVRGDELSSFMLRRFSHERDSTNRLIDAHIKAAELATTATPTTSEHETVVGTVRQRTRSFKQRRVPTWAYVAGGLSLAIATATAATWSLRRAPAPPDPPPAAPAAGRGATPPLTCEAGFKRCGAECVSVERPDVGCGNDDCSPCLVPNATPRCNPRHACDIAVCYRDHDNCDGELANGCETEVRIDPNNCGSCGHKCPPLPHARSGCGDVCSIWRCEEGYRDCNGALGDGCETHVVDDAKNCGHCGMTCAHGLHCRTGHCVP
jgi:serine/threonine protein kinase